MNGITKEREAREWTKTELSRRAKVQPSRISAIENGRSLPYSPELKRIARALKYEGDPADLVREVDVHEPA